MCHLSCLVKEFTYGGASVFKTSLLRKNSLSSREGFFQFVCANCRSKFSGGNSDSEYLAKNSWNYHKNVINYRTVAQLQLDNYLFNLRDNYINQTKDECSSTMYVASFSDRAVNGQ